MDPACPPLRRLKNIPLWSPIGTAIKIHPSITLVESPSHCRCSGRANPKGDDVPQKLTAGAPETQQMAVEFGRRSLTNVNP